MENQEGIRNVNDNGRVKRTGTIWTASAHIITAVLGPEVLSLSWAISQLGWIAGSAVLFLFAIVTYYTSILMAARYRAGGQRNRTYMDAVRSILGDGFRAKLCCATQYLNLFGVVTGCVITASTSMRAIQRSNCINPEGIDGPCEVSIVPYVVAFGVVQLILSQIPSFHQIWLLSIVSATMSSISSSIVIVLGIAKVVEAGEIRGSLSGIRIGSVTEKIFLSFQAAGSIAFAYSFSPVLFEIQDTIGPLQHTIDSPPSEYNIMKRAIHWSIIITTIVHMLCGCAGYAAFGDLSPANILTGFGSYSSRNWLLDIANVAIVIHRIGAYQVFCQPIFAFIEKTASDRFPNSTFINQEIQVLRTTYGLNLFKITSRCIFVIITTIISMFAAPFFSDGFGVLGAIGLWRLTFHLPVAMHIAQDKVPKWSKKWVCLQILSMACLVISVAAAIGSFVGLVSNVKRRQASQH